MGFNWTHSSSDDKSLPSSLSLKFFLLIVSVFLLSTSAQSPYPSLALMVSLGFKTTTSGFNSFLNLPLVPFYCGDASWATLSGLVLKLLESICCFMSFFYFHYVDCLVFWFLTLANWFANWVSSSEEFAASPFTSSS